MRQIIHAARCLSIALVLVATFVTIAGAPQVSAETINPTRGEMEAVCLAEGGIYWEEYEHGVLVRYGCAFLDGAEWHCDASGKFCWYIMSYPTVEKSTAPQPTDPTYRDPYPPVQSAPADSYQSGYDYELAGQ